MTCYLCGYPPSERRLEAEWERRDGVDICGDCVRLHVDAASAATEPAMRRRLIADYEELRPSKLRR